MQEINSGRDIDGDGVIGSVSKAFGPPDQPDKYSYSAGLYINADTDGSYDGQNIGKGNTRLISTGTVKSGLLGHSSPLETARVGEAIVKDATELTLMPGGGVFANDFMALNGGAETESYTSALGTTYTEQVLAAVDYKDIHGNILAPHGTPEAYKHSEAGRHGNIGSNGNITVKNGGDTIGGDAKPGPGCTTSDPGHHVIAEADTTPRETKLVLPDPYIPPALLGVSLGTAISAGTMGVAGTATNYHWASWSQQAGKNGTIDVPAGAIVNIVVDNGVNLKSNMTLGKDAKVNLFIKDGTFSANANGDASTTRTNDFNIVYCGTTQMRFTGQYTLFGTLYAPKASVWCAGGFDLYGAMVVKDLTSVGQANFHVDLMSTTPGIHPRVQLVAVREIDSKKNKIKVGK